MIPYNPGMFYHPTVDLEELSVRKQIKNKLRKCTYEQLYTIAAYHRTKEDKLNELSIIN